MRVGRMSYYSIDDAVKTDETELEDGILKWNTVLDMDILHAVACYLSDNMDHRVTYLASLNI